MKRNSSIFTGSPAQSARLVLIIFILTVPAYCGTSNTALLIQQSPLDAGTVTPSPGVHNFELNTEVTLTAVPEPGYQFVYWLGDVSDPTSSRTIVLLNAPKIVIAVFERVEYEVLSVIESSKSMPIGGLILSAGDYGRQGYSGGGGRRPRSWSWPQPPEPEPWENDDLPVPKEGLDDFPVPDQGEDEFPVPNLPEPATVLTLAFGALLARKCRRGR